MKPHWVYLFCCALVFAIGVTNANAQSKAAAQPHIDNARAAAYEPGHDITNLFDRVCAPALSDKGPTEETGPQTTAPLSERRVPPHNQWYTAPAKVFDNLYWFGSNASASSVPQIDGDSSWAVTASEGIILIDSGQDFTAKELIADGMKKMGLDPAQIKYVVLSHAHGDRYYGSKYLQDTYHTRLVMSEADWNTMAKSTEPNELKPKKDMVATDGMKLTLGDTTVTLYMTPGHTPGTISTIVSPLKDGNQRHVGAVLGGINPSFQRYGVKYFSSLSETYKTWSASLARFMDITQKANADVYLTLHPIYDKALDKIHLLHFRKPGDTHPMVSKSNVQRFLTIIKECTDAQMARLATE